MIRNKKVVCLIPSRSGSKRLKDKNILEFNNHPLMAHSIMQAKDCKYIDEVIVSTDSEIYASIAKDYGARILGLRDKELSSDEASSWDVAIDTLMRLKQLNESFDILILLQPTSPLRKPVDIYNALELFLNKNAKYLASVSPTNLKPVLFGRQDENNIFFKICSTNSNASNRNLVRLNGAIYITNTTALVDEKTLPQDNFLTYLMSPYSSIDIDDELDFKVAEYLHNNN